MEGIIFAASVALGVMLSLLVKHWWDEYGKSDKEKSTTIFVRTSGLENLKAEYKANYLWACNMFGVSSNVFTDTSETEYDGRYWLYNHVVLMGDSYRSKYIYPRGLPFPKTKISGTECCHNEDIQPWVYDFMVEFNGIVNKLKTFYNSDDIKLYIKYDVSYKCLLKNVLGD